MSMMSEQAKELREIAHSLELFPIHDFTGTAKTIKRAADTIESLSAKLQAANEELDCWHTEKINDKIKNPFAWTSTAICHNCDHKDEYIEELEAEVEELKAENMEQSAGDCDGWIPCKEKLPEDGVDVLVWFEYFRYGEYNRLFQTKGISYTFNGEWSGFVNNQSGWNQLRIIAWQPLPEDYYEP